MKRTVTMRVVLILGWIYSTPAEAHEVPYVQIVACGNPTYIVQLGLNVETLEERTRIGIKETSSRYWEFSGNDVVKYAEFVRRDLDTTASGKTFEEVVPKSNIPLTGEAVVKKEIILQIVCWYQPWLDRDSCVMDLGP